jgi:DNA-binding CsgD family transcriptional regulator
MTQTQALSTREQEVVDHLLKGKSNKLIASALGISARTVEFHLKNIYNKFQVNTRTELILKLGTSTGADKGRPVDNLGRSTVAEREEISENRDSHRATSLREAVSIIGKELRMDSLINAREEANPETFFGAIRVCLTKYAEFSGRATRAEFCWFALFVTLVSLALGYLSQELASVFSVAMLLPFLAAGARRLHDINKSGWWQLFMLVPAAGFVAVAILWMLPTDYYPDSA